MAAVLLDEVRLDEGLRDRERLVKVEGLLEESHKHVATKADVQAVKSDLQVEIAGVQAALQIEIAGTKSDLQAEIAGVRVDVQSVRTELVGVQAALQAEIADVRVDVQSVRTELADVKSDMRWLKWLLGAGVSLSIALSTGILLLLLRMAGGL